MDEAQMDETPWRQVYGLLGELLDYPHAHSLAAARECEEVLGRLAPGCRPPFRRFRRFLEMQPAGKQQALYTETFDLDPTCAPYIGYHLFGESYKRSALLLHLKQSYRIHKINAGVEVPDHLMLVLRLMAFAEDELQRDLLQLAVLPALDRMTGRVASAGYDGEEASAEPATPKASLARARQPYRELIEAVRSLLLVAAASVAPAQQLEGASIGSG